MEHAAGRYDLRGSSIDDAVRQLGHVSLRPGQRAAIESVLAGHDVLCVMPTGAGKSLVYQVAGLLLEGPTVVVSPLLALQRDQVSAIDERVHGAAAMINAAVPRDASRSDLEAVRDGELEYVFVAPEQLENEETFAMLAAARPSLLVIDEAHCVSEWGHDFRPAYLGVRRAAEALGRPTLLALTATASPAVREDIVSRLGLRDPEVFVHGFDRPNISLAVERFGDARERDAAVVQRVVLERPPGIVYRSTRAAAERLARSLRGAGVRATAYHAGLGAAERASAQERFMSDDIDVVVATVAFGLGIDKPDVRFVHHAEPPDSLDAYAQEMGRAGRDGGPAAAILHFVPSDFGRSRFRTAAMRLTEKEVGRVLRLLAGRRTVPASALAATSLSRARLALISARLEDAGVVAVDGEGVLRRRGRFDLPAVARDVVAAQERLRTFAQTRAAQLRAYAETEGCRRVFLLGYFGEVLEAPCGNCDACAAGRVEAARDDVPFPPGARVRHSEWGAGTVQRYDGASAMTVLFDAHGYRVLDVAIVTEQGLLTPASTRARAGPRSRGRDPA